MNDPVSLALRFIEAMNEGKHGEALHAFYADDVEHIEFPNTLTKSLTVRDIDALKDGSVKGQKIFSSQQCEVLRTYASGQSSAAIEAVWTGTLAIPFGKHAAGGQMKAYFAQFFEFNEAGKITKQRNYDCFEPFM